MKKNVIEAIRDNAILLTGMDDLQPLLNEIKNVPYVMSLGISVTAIWLRS